MNGMNQDEAGRLTDDCTVLNLKTLRAAAQRSEDGEAYVEVSRDANHRMGVVASALPSGCVYYTVECTFRLCPGDASVEPAALERAAEISREMERRGYDLAHLGDGWISCEKSMSQEDVDTEIGALLHSISRWPGGPPVTRAVTRGEDPEAGRHPAGGRDSAQATWSSDEPS